MNGRGTRFRPICCRAPRRAADPHINPTWLLILAGAAAFATWAPGCLATLPAFRLGIAYLQVGKIPAPTEHVIAYLSSIGVKATGSAGVFRGNATSLEVAILIKNPRWVTAAGG